jgi:hypothetical protein
LKAIHPGHADVEQHEIRRVVARHRQRFGTGVRGFDVVSLRHEQRFQQLAVHWVIVDDQNALAHASALTGTARSRRCVRRLGRFDSGDLRFPELRARDFRARAVHAGLASRRLASDSAMTVATISGKARVSTGFGTWRTQPARRQRSSSSF